MTAAECLCKLSPGETLGELSLRLEEEAGTPREKALEKLSGMLSVMESEVQNALHIPVHSISGLTGGDGCRYERYRVSGGSLLGEIPALATAYALSASETNAAMGRIVACPTDGSCGIRPACVLAIDALAARSVHRLCRTVQLSDTGIVPGSGVGNHRRGLTEETLGVPVVSLGVPTVVDGATLIEDLLGESTPADVPGRELFVTPREVDSRVADLSRVLGYGVSRALNPSLSVEELNMLIE